MSTHLEDYRKSYEKGALLEAHIPADPFVLFTQWFKEVEASEGVDEVNAMTIATMGTDGFPKSRVVLLKSFSEEGFVFYTNYNSEKAEAIATNPKICLSFFWPNLERQVIIKATVQKLSEQDSEAYFKQRPRGSQIGAWVSNQSAVIDSREVLEEKTKTLEAEFSGKSIPKPPHWGGYIAQAHSLEFWQGRQNRLHDRMLYSHDKNEWKRQRLAP